VENLIALHLQTGYEGQPHVEASGSVFRIFGYGQYPAIELAINSDQKAVLRFYNEETGEFLYDLGPDEINKNVSQIPDKWEEWRLYKVQPTDDVKLHVYDSMLTSYYRYKEGYTKTGNVKTYTSGGTTPGSDDGKFFSSKSTHSLLIPNGTYRKADNGTFLQVMSDTDATKYGYTTYQFSGGKLINSTLFEFYE
jgi:hypothetical protein